LLARERGLTVDNKGFKDALKIQKQRSQADAAQEVGDWHLLTDDPTVNFVGYDQLQASGKVVKYRTVNVKKKDQYQVVLDTTPFYAEGGGQIGDTGSLNFDGEEIRVVDTKRENDLIIHYVNKLPSNINAEATAQVNENRRKLIINNHSATHLLHAALREVLGTHVQQKGSLVADTHLRFDFSHFQKVTEEELAQIELIVNRKIRENIPLEELRAISIEDAKAKGAMMLFGEKYGDTVRMITFDPSFSRELCGGCHVQATGVIGSLKITIETSVGAGVRRIEAVTAGKAEAYVNKEIETLDSIRGLFKNPKHIVQNIQSLQEENKALKKQLEEMQNAQAGSMKRDLINSAVEINGFNFIGAKLPIQDSKTIKSLSYQIKEEMGDVVVVFGAEINGKPQLAVTVSERLIEEKQLHAGNLVREIAKEIQGGGGGQAFFATAGGKNAGGIESAIAKAKEILE